MQHINSSSGSRVGSQKLLKMLLLMVLVMATLVVYYPVGRFDFLNYDDNVVVTENAHVKYGIKWEGVKWAFLSYRQANWVPLTWISHALDCQLYGLRPGPHHEMNLLLHLICVLLLFWVLVRATGAAGRSFMVAALFALHPVNVESVAWIASRRNMLSMLFFLLALRAYHWYALRPRIGRYLVVVLLYILGFMSKAQVITLPFVLLLWDYWPLGRIFATNPDVQSTSAPPRKLSFVIVEKAPLLVLAALGAVVTAKVQVVGGGTNPDVSVAFRLENALFSYIRYLSHALWPVRLANLYPLPVNSLRGWQALVAAVILLAITIGVIRLGRWRYLPVGWFWFLGTLVPMIGIMQLGRHAMADRYAYLPLIGIFIMFCWAIPDFCVSMPEGSVLGSPLVLRTACAAVLVMLGIAAHRQVGYWKDNETLWTHTLLVTKDNYQAEDQLASELIAQDRCTEALEHLRRAQAINQSYPLTNFHTGLCEQRIGNLQMAIQQYQKVIDLTENDIAHNANINLRHAAFGNLAIAYRDSGDMDNYWRNRGAASELVTRYGTPR